MKTNQKIVSFTYLNNTIRFSVDGSVMINATEMAKPFKKRPKDWLILKSTKEFIRVYSVRRNILLTDLVVVIKGGTPQMQGTWMHEDIALEFARWLSPEFAIWCNDRIREILQGKQSNSLYAYLEQEVLKASKQMKDSQEAYARKYGITLYSADIAKEVKWDARLDPKANIDRLLHSLIANTSMAWYNFHEKYRLQKEDAPFWRSMYLNERDVSRVLLAKLQQQ